MTECSRQFPPNREERSRILIVDDEQQIRELLVRILAESDHEVFTAGDCAKAMDILSHTQIDLAVVDLKMPGMNGETLMKEIRSNDIDISLITLTGHGDQRQAYSLLKEYQISDFLQKPLKSPFQLLYSVESALEKRRMLKQLKAHSEALEQYRMELEQQVDERTHSLKESNSRLKSEIAERRRIERQLIAARDEAEAANSAKSEFVATMSHELRTPLNHIIGFTQLVLSGRWGEVNEEQGEYLAHALQSSKHLASLVNDILDLSKIEARRMELEMAKVDIRGLLENSIVMIRDSAQEKRIELISNIDDIPEYIDGDERKIKQIVYNLLTNAVKFTREHGNVTLNATVTPNAISINSPAKLPIRDRRLVIAVSDDGIGITPENLHTIFQPFKRSKRATILKVQGTGLGLSLAKSLAEMHDGTLTAHSDGADKGTTFILELPVCAVRCASEHRLQTG